MLGALPPGFEDDDDDILPVPEGGDVVMMGDERKNTLLEQRANEWRHLNFKRYGVRRAFVEATSQAKDDDVPPEYLRKIIKDQGDLSSKKYKAERKLFVGAFPCMPLAIMKLLETMPMPWEDASRKVQVVFHVNGALTVVDETPKTAAPLFKAQWASVYTAMRRHKVELKQEGGHFQRVKFPVFDPNEPPFDFADHLQDATYDPLYSIDDDEFPHLSKWFYSEQPVVAEPNKLNLRRGQWYFSLEVLESLLRLSFPFVHSHVDDENVFYLWNLRSFFTAKALNVAIPRAPKFDRLRGIADVDGRLDGEAEDDEEDWTEFNDLRRIIFRDDPDKPKLTLLTERQIAFPFLYGKSVRRVTACAPYHTPPSLVLPHDDPSIAVFHFDPALNPIRAVDRTFSEADVNRAAQLQRQQQDATHFMQEGEVEDDDEMPPLILPDGFSPFLAELPLEHPQLQDAMQVLHAPKPFDTFAGSLQRRMDVDLMEEWYRLPPQLQTEDTRDKITRSYTKLLKRHVKQQLYKEHHSQRKEESGKRKIDKLAESKYFQRTKIEWLEAGLQIIRQGHTMLTQLITLKSLPYLHLDYNFNIEPTRTLTTKERKKSRLGASVKVLAELLKLTKYMVDLHVKARLGHIDSYQLADGIQYVYSHLGKLTSIYQHKGRVMRQVNQSRDYKHVIYSRFNTGEVQRGPGVGFWAPNWRLWMYFLRGIVPWLQTALTNLITRLFEGRKSKGMRSGLGRRITRQRVDSDKDVNVKEAFRREIQEILPEGTRPGVIRELDKHLNEAFRCWKSNRRWEIEGLHPTLAAVIRKYTTLRAEEFVRHTHAVRRQIDTGDTVDKNRFMKNLGRMTRLKLMAEQERQKAFHVDGVGVISPEDSTAIYELMSNWLSSRNFRKIPFPKQAHPAEMDLLRLALERLREQHNIANRLTQQEREEQQMIEMAFDSGHETLAKIREALARQRRFKAVQVEYIDNFSHLHPIYSVNPTEKMVDAFLDAYLWYEATDKQKLFPNWVKPSDEEPNPVLVHKWCSGINNIPHVWETDNHESVVSLQMDLGESFYDNVNWTLFRKLLELIMDKTLVDYIVARQNVKLEYKDMEHDHLQGLIRGFRFSGFLAQYWGLVMDVLLLGSKRSQEIAGPPTAPNPFMKFRDAFLATSHPIAGYCRYNNQITILLRFTEKQAEDLLERYLNETNEDPAMAAINKSVIGFKTHKNWPADCRMRLYLGDVNLARAVLWDFQGRIPSTIANVDWSNSSVSVYSKNNPNLLFELCGFSVRMLPASRTEVETIESENMWILIHQQTKEITARAFIQCSPDSVKHIQNKIRRAIMSVGNAPFQAIAAKWNALVSEIAPYYREAILGTDGLQEIFAKGERKMQARIMMALNSKNCARFPAVVFHAPAEMGGLGMFSVGQSLIPVKDTTFSKQTSTGIQHFMSGITNIDSIPIPSILQHYTPWSTEIMESAKAWEEFSFRHKEAKLKGMRVSLDDVQAIIDKGIPRIRVRFSKNANLFHFDRGFRVRQEFQKYCLGKYMKNWWFHPEHDGYIVNSTKEYSRNMIAALGGVEAILEHSLFRGTGIASWEGIWWNTKGRFENSKKDANITKAMRGGLTVIPNKRFALWWSPTINRSDIYGGYTTKIDLMGVFMCGKLAMIKEAMIKLFAGHLWDHIHSSIVRDISSKLSTDDVSRELEIGQVTLPQNHPHKSFTYHSSAADVVLHAANKWLVSDLASSLGAEEEKDTFTRRKTDKYWIDVQLRWGDYDAHNIADYARSKFHEYSRDGRTMYPCPAGVIVAVDLAYNCYSAYGMWIPGMKRFLTSLMNVILRVNIQLTVLRDRMKRDLAISTSNPTEQSLTTTNLQELCSNKMRVWIVDESLAYVTSKMPTADGNLKYKSENGAVFMFDPQNGDLRYSVLHRSIFVGKKRRTKLAKDKAAEEIATWLRSLSPAEQPEKLIVTRKVFCQTLKQSLVDFPNIVVCTSELNLALTMIHRHSTLGNLRTTATTSKLLRFCVYDSWLTQMQPYTAFMLLNLILRGYYININRTKEILEPDLHVEKQPNHFWPTYSRDEWQRVSDHIQEMVIADYCRRNNTSVNQLTKSEMFDILVGKQITTLELQADELKQLEQQEGKLKKIELAQPVTTTYVNKVGDVVTRQVRAVYDYGGSAVSDWRPRSIADVTLIKRSEVLDVPVAPTGGSGSALSKDTIVFPRNLLHSLVQSGDVHAQVVAYMFGNEKHDKSRANHDEVRGGRRFEVRCLMLPPQVCSRQGVKTPSNIPVADPTLTQDNLLFLGVLRLVTGEVIPTTRDLALSQRVMATSPPEDIKTVDVAPDDETSASLFTAVVGLSDAVVTLQSYATTPAGRDWASENYLTALEREPQEVQPECIRGCRSALSSDFNGFFLVPTNRIWNHSFIGVTWKADDVFDVVVDDPQEFFSSISRPDHFRSFLQQARGQQAAVGIDVMDLDESN